MSIIPAIVIQHSAITHPVTKFDYALQVVVATLNSKAGGEFASVRRMGPLNWTIMGTEFYEFIDIKLDQSFTFIQIESLLPVSRHIKHGVVEGELEKSIYMALCALRLYA